MVKQAIADGLDVEPLTNKLNNSQFTELFNKLTQESLSLSVVMAFQWAQSPNKIFLDVKFSHRIDSPPCIKLNNLDVKIEPTNVRVKGDCEHTGQSVIYKLDLNLWNHVDPEKSTYNTENRGHLFINLVKKDSPSYWPLPIAGKNRPKNMHVWWSMKEKYEDDMDEMMSDYEDDSDVDAFVNSKSRLVNKKRGKDL